MTLLAIDPGNEQSAYVVYRDGKPESFGKVDNAWFLDRVRTGHFDASHMAVEMIASYGMPVGREVFETCLMIGRLLEAWSSMRATRGQPHEHTLVYRKDVKLHLCGQARAKDPNIRRALIDRYGGDVATKKGGPLYKISADVWSALAIAVTWSETRLAPQKEQAA